MLRRKPLRWAGRNIRVLINTLGSLRRRFEWNNARVARHWWRQRERVLGKVGRNIEALIKVVGRWSMRRGSCVQ
ncbi:hypothetical protein U1Q18_051946, partial [Sarracenia purpurea var. burkii]